MQIQQRSGSSSMDGFIKKTGAEWGDKNFDRYFRNEGKAKKPLMDQGSVDAREERILDHALSTMESFQTTEKQTFVPTFETDCKPLFVFNETGSGKSLLMSLGSADFPNGVPKSMWQFKSQRQDDSIQLRPGLRGRHKFSPGHTHSPLAGKCFEWRVVVDTRVHSRGGYRFQVYEVATNETGLRKKTTVYYGHAPQEAWSAMYSNEAPETRCNSGVKLCGVTEPAILALLDVARVNLVTQAIFRQKSYKKLSDFKERRLREFNAMANQSFYNCMLALNPEDPSEAFMQLQKNSKWQHRWNKDWTIEQVLKLPMVKELQHTYKKPGGTAESKLMIMSMFSPHYALKVTMKVFECTEKAVCKSRLYAADGGAGTHPVRLNHRRMRVDPQKFAYMRGWCRSSFAGKEGDPSSNDIQLQKIAARLYPEYCRMARKEMPTKAPMSSTEFYLFLKTGGFVNQNEETCCCGGCCDGWLNIQEFQSFIGDPFNDVTLVKERVKRLDEIKAFYNGPYRWEHLSPESEISTHCMHHALSTGHACYNVECKHKHKNTCSECNQWSVLMSEVKAELNDRYSSEMTSLGEAALSAHDDGDFDTVGVNVALAADLKEKHRCWVEQLKVYDDEQTRYVGHVVRKHNSSRAKVDQLADVTPLWIKLTIDYKQKVLSREHRQKQSNNFGKKGKSLFGLTAECEIPEDFTGELPKGFEREGDYAIYHVRVCADDADQDWWHSAQVFFTSIRLLQQALPWRVEGGYLSSDGAVNFKTLAFMVMVTQISEETGFKIKNHTFPEAGDGKDRCDRDFAGVNNVIDGYMKQEGTVMVCADDICTALESQKQDDPAAYGHIINCALKIQRPTAAVKKARKKALNTKRFATLAGSALSPMSKENMYHFEFAYDPSGSCQGVRAWAYYEPKAAGRYITMEQLLSCWKCDVQKMSEYFPIITAGTDLITGPQMKTDVKTEKGREHKKKDKAAVNAKKAEKAAKTKQEQARLEGIAASYRTSFRCFSCEKAYMREKSRNLHSKGCQPPLSFAESKEAKLSKFTHTFDTLRGHSLDQNSSSSIQVPLKELCLTSPDSTIQKLVKTGPDLIESAVASAVRALIDELIFTEEKELPMLSAGWATREACTRPNVRYCKDLVSQLCKDFDAQERINHIQISRKLKALFRDPKMHLRPSQVQSWISSEVLRRKKKVLLATAEGDSGKPEEEVLQDMLDEMIKQLEVEAKKSAKEDLRKEKQATKDKAAADRQAARERVAADRQAARERVAAEKKAARERVAAERQAARDKETAEKEAARERVPAERQAAKDKETAEKEAARERVAAEREVAKRTKEAAAVEKAVRGKATKGQGAVKKAARGEAAMGEEATLQTGTKNKRQKLIGKPAVITPVEPLVKRKQPGRLIGHAHCWVCDDEIPEAQYSHAKERCIDQERCKAAAEEKATQTRSRKRNKKYDD